jgi:glycosyltransferase involved in cell wall biosynthesis
LASLFPAYNEEKLIGKVLKTTPEFRNHIIMMDDASLNRNREIVQAYRKEGPRIIYIRHQKNETFPWRLK